MSAAQIVPAVCFSVMGLALFVSSAMWAPSAVAAEDDRDLVIEEVLVTARRREESAQDVPIPITALTQELTKSNIRNLSDLNGFAPNVNIGRDSSRSNAASVTIRGISPTRTDDNSLDSPVGIMIDGIYLGSLAGQLLENFDLERVEVLRGPQGTLFGRNTVGGVVNVVRSRPTGELGGKLRLTAGEDGQREFRGVMNFPIMDERLAGKLFYTNLQFDGFLPNDTVGGKQPEKDYQNYGLTLLANPTENFEALLTLERFVDKSQGGAFLTNYNLAPGVATAPADSRETDLSGGFLGCVLPFGGVPCRTSLDFPSRGSADLKNPSHLETDAITLNMSWDLNDTWRVVSLTGYREQQEDRKYDFDGSSANFITIDRRNDFEQFSQELRLEGTWDNVNLVIGGYHWNSEFTQDWATGGEFWSFVGLLSGYSLEQDVWINPALEAANGGLSPVTACLGPGSGDPLNPNARDTTFGNVNCDPGVTGPYGPGFLQRLYSNQETTANAVFAQVDWTFAENWTLTAGLRWTNEEKEFIAGQAYLSPLSRFNVDAFPSFADLKEDWTEVSPKIGITWQATDDVLVYASYAEGFHSGGFFGVNQNIADFERDIYDPEIANNYEIGFKSQLFNNRVQFNASYFFNDFEDKQESSVQVDPSTNTVATVFSNAAGAEYQGIEMELQWVATADLNVFASFGWLDAEYVDFETDVNANDGVNMIVDASFLTPRNAPEITYGVGGTWSKQIGAGELEVFAKYAFIDEIQSDLLNLAVGEIDSRDDLGISVSYSQANWRFTVFGRNLTDEEFETPALIVPLFAAGTVNQGSNWGAEFEYRFE
ncbi:MAG: TonB-dependent receptor [Pseudomonadales bacterium]